MHTYLRNACWCVLDVTALLKFTTSLKISVFIKPSFRVVSPRLPFKNFSMIDPDGEDSNELFVESTDIMGVPDFWLMVSLISIVVWHRFMPEIWEVSIQHKHWVTSCTTDFNLISWELSDASDDGTKLVEIPIKLSAHDPLYWDSSTCKWNFAVECEKHIQKIYILF